MPWVILGRVLRGEPGPDAVEPDFITTPVLLPPGVTIPAAGRGAQPKINKPDMYPYIIATSRFCLLAHFAVAPSNGTSFEDSPQNTHLVLVRNFHRAPGQITATAEQVPRRSSHVPGLRNIQGVGLLSWVSDNDGPDAVRTTIIAELQVDRAGDRFRAMLLRFRDGRGWSRKKMPCPLPAANREWAPHGAVSFNTTICWFDLSWGMLTCDLDPPVGEQFMFLRYHPLPEGQMLQQAPPDIHSRRCITVTRNDNLLRYVDIVPAAAGEAAPPTVTMWTRRIRVGAWEWVTNYAMSFDRIWDDDSYAETGLPREVPVLALVSPSDHQIVFFALEQIIFGVNVPAHRVEHRALYNLVNLPGQQLPASGRYLVDWTLPV
ncbi:hypothetical protein BS78_08G134600 [Paspalum vaginatum]|nr:hypothetical protein BS78_08G134600 [Paspalum vaginatum]